MEKKDCAANGHDGLIRKALWGLILLGSALRIFVCFEQNPLDFLFSDPARHWSNGLRFFHPSYIGAGDSIFFQAYVHFLQVVSGNNREFIAGSSALLSVIMPWTYYRAARESGLTKIPSLGVWALIAWNPSLIVIYHYMMIETLLLVIVGLSLWSTLRCLRVPSHSSWLLTVLLWTLTVLTKTSILPLAATCVLYLWWKTSKRLLWIATALALVVVMLIPSGIRSQKYLGFIAPLGNPWVVELVHRANTRGIQIDVGTAKYFFSSPSANSRPLDPLSPWMIQRAHTDSILHVIVDPQNGSRDWQQAASQIHPDLPTRLHELFENTVLFLFSPTWPDSDCTSWDGWINFYARWMWAPLIFFVLDCNLREFWRGHFHLVPVAVTILTLFLAFQNMATMEGRYRKPLEPLLLLNLVLAFSCPLRQFRQLPEPRL
jgi:hypothetical protein